VRPISGVNSNLIAYTAFAKPGDTVLALSIPNGGHISYGKYELGGTAGAVRGLDVQYFSFDEEMMNIDVDATKVKVQKLINEGKTPKIAIFGASVFLFPHPVKELESFFKALRTTVMYDSAHVLGLIAGNKFQDPLREGADVVTGSTHKTLPGPQGGIILSWDKYSDILKKAAFPGNLSNHHLHSVAGKAVAFSEMIAFGSNYASQVIENAHEFAVGLASNGFKVLGEKVGYTKSHQVIIDVSKYGGGGKLEKTLERANIIVNRNMIHDDIKAGRHFDNPGGLRFGVQELTRIGMKKDEMRYIADLVGDIIIRQKDPNDILKQVKELRVRFRTVKYCFEDNEAYNYYKLRMSTIV
jgi:glycine hydroxymethyltransferase